MIEYSFISAASAKKAHFKGALLTFLTEFAGEAVNALALLPGPVVQTGAPVSAGAGGAGSVQSRTSADAQTNSQTDSLTSQLGGVGWWGDPLKRRVQK